MLTKEIIDILKKVHFLAKDQKQQRYKSDEIQEFDLSDIDIDKLFFERESSELLKFLSLQDYKTALIILTVMYIGSDYIPETEEEYEKRMEYNYDNPEDPIPAPSLRCANPNALLKEWLPMIEHSGSYKKHGKNIVVDQIYGKELALDEYLEKSFVILGI